MPREVLIIRHSGLRQVSLAEVLPAIPAAEAGLPRADEHVDTTVFAPQIEQDDWGEQDSYLRERVSRISALAEQQGDVVVHYFGLAEIPHMLALGAYLGDERHVVIHEFDRDSSTWRWPQSECQIRTETYGLPSVPPVTARGDAILRVEISATISDENVREVVGDNVLVSVRVTMASGLAPATCRVRSEADLMQVRVAVREALASLKQCRPNLDTIHLFVAGPASVCFAIGQELKPRNSAPIQTYRYRAVEGQPSFKPALVLRGGQGEARESPLSGVQTERARQVRGIWGKVVEQLERYATNQRAATTGAPWYIGLLPSEALLAAAPFPTLKALAQLVPEGAGVDPNPLPAEYGFDKDRKLWRVSDRLLVGLDEAARDDEQLVQIIRLFMFHEYLHDFHSLTKYTAAEVGKFANCLEYIDYTADAYALIHQLDYQHVNYLATLNTDDSKRQFLAGQVELVVRSFWAFEPSVPVVEWQVRRLRRYLNWYWRQVQIKRARRLETAVRLLAAPPHVEIAGLHQFARGRRVLVRLDRPDRGTSLELALVMEDCRLMRMADSPTLSVSGMSRAFMYGQHEEIQQFFNAVYEEAAQRSGALPSEDAV